MMRISQSPDMTLNRKAKERLLELSRERAARRKEKLLQINYSGWYWWQRKFCASTKDNFECCLMAGNQIGKSKIGTEIDAFHLTGDYPEDYPGHIFKHAPLMWCLGYSMEKTRDLLQTKLFGKYDRADGFSGGLVPKSRIVGWEHVNVPNAMRTVTVRHKSGGTSTCQFWSYKQGQHSIMGDVVDWFHVDEEPVDQTIRPQLLTRTINGDKGRGGRGIYTFTPENGRTSLVVKFMDDPSDSQAFLKIGWSEAPHITPEKAERLLSQYPEHQRKMRSEGEPMLGHGRIYDIADEFILCDPFPIPDFWDVIVGMDFGYDHPQGFTKLAIDPDNDIAYLTNSWKASKLSANDAWGATKAWAAGCPVAWPADGLMHEKGRDVVTQQKDHYIDAGFQMLFEHASWQDGGNSVENGLYEIMERQRKGQFKVFRGNEAYMEEHRNYHRDEKGKIVKVDDDLVDSARYAYMMRRFSKKRGQVGVDDVEFKMPMAIKAIGGR